MPPEPDLLVACLCAAWCDVCRDYRAGFDAAAARLGAAQVRFVWIDVEDEAEAVGELEVENFPSLLLARGGVPIFVGPVQPQPGVLDRLVDRARAGQLPPLADAPEAARLAAHLVGTGRSMPTD